MTDHEAMQLALEALENVTEDYVKNRQYKHNKAITALRERLAQPEQRPVACRFCGDDRGCWAWQCNHCGEIDDAQKPAPPQRTLVGLTDAELAEFSKAKLGAYDLCLEVEAKLREKNNG